MNQLFVSKPFVSGISNFTQCNSIFVLLASCHVTRKATSKCSCMISYRATAGTLALRLNAIETASIPKTQPLFTIANPLPRGNETIRTGSTCSGAEFQFLFWFRHSQRGRSAFSNCTNGLASFFFFCLFRFTRFN